MRAPSHRRERYRSLIHRRLGDSGAASDQCTLRLQPGVSKSYLTRAVLLLRKSASSPGVSQHDAAGWGTRRPGLVNFEPCAGRFGILADLLLAAASVSPVPPQ